MDDKHITTFPMTLETVFLYKLYTFRNLLWPRLELSKQDPRKLVLQYLCGTYDLIWQFSWCPAAQKQRWQLWLLRADGRSCYSFVTKVYLSRRETHWSPGVVTDSPHSALGNPSLLILTLILLFVSLFTYIHIYVHIPCFIFLAGQTQ